MKTRKNTSSKRQKMMDIKNRAKSRVINQSSTDSLKQTFSDKSKQVETKGKPREPMFQSLDLEGAAKKISAMQSKKRKKHRRLVRILLTQQNVSSRQPNMRLRTKMVLAQSHYQILMKFHI